MLNPNSRPGKATWTRLCGPASVGNRLTCDFHLAGRPDATPRPHDDGEPTVITRGGIAVAAIVPMSDCDALEEAADEVLTRTALRTLAEERATLADLLADIFGRPAPDGM
ncbi:hypothetical protein [Streptomyces sp. NBC_01288]|uniref:hypothetical protein n=1 Tax=Streptomyces sp. NBC_01288 TaxID=2903814 RepID=UPI003FA3CBF8